MDFWDATKVLVRRWYIAVPLFLLTLGATGYTAVMVKADYVLTSYVQLIPPSTVPDKTAQHPGPSNPWNQLGLEALSNAANYATVDQTFLDSLGREGNSTNFKITVGDPAAGATIQVVAATRDQAVNTTDAVIKRYRDSAQRLQSQYGVQTADMITVQRLDQGENLKRPGGKVKRAIIAVFGTGVLLTCAMAIGIDAFFRRRRRRGWAIVVPQQAVDAKPVDARNGYAADEVPVHTKNGYAAAAIQANSSNGHAADTASVDSGNGHSDGVLAGWLVGTSEGPRSVTKKASGSDGSDNLQIPVAPGEETIVLPLTPDWSREDIGGSRR